MKIDFYLLQSGDITAGYHYICRWLAKAYRLEKSVLVLFDDEKKAQYLDNLLWTFDESSFIAHSFAGQESENESPIQLATSLPANPPPLLLALQNNICPQWHNFARVIEIIANDAQEKALARQRYRAYQEQGAQITTHKIS